MNKSGFMRLFFLAFTMLVAILPVQAYVLYYDLTLSLPWHPYSWNKIHGPEWSQIQKVATYGIVFFDRWTPIAAGLMVFIFFGFGRDATKMYRLLFWYLGFGYCFPGVRRPLDSHASASAPAPNASIATTLVGSVSSKAKSFFKKGTSSQYVISLYFGRFVANHWKSTSTLATHDGSYNDIETGRISSTVPVGNVRTGKLPWYRSFFNRRKASRHVGEDTLLDDLSVPQTIYTSAWAGTSQSRPSNEFSVEPSSPQTKDFIHVKQVIRQQSEIQT